MTEGYTLELVQESWPQLDKKIRNGVRKAERFLMVRVGSLEELRRLHWNPVYLPRSLALNMRVYVATLEGKPVSAIMVEVQGQRLKYRYAANDTTHRDLQGNSLLLWHLSTVYPGYTLDLGGSQVPSIARFKRRFSTGAYEYEARRTLLGRLRFRLLRWLPAKVCCPYGVWRWQRGELSCNFHEDCRHWLWEEGRCGL